MPKNDDVFYTVKLNIKRIQEEEDFIDESFNAVIDDIDKKVVGIAHLTSGAHWTVWEEDTTYSVGDVIRWPNMKSHQYAKCIEAGTTGVTMPEVNVTGSEVTSGTSKWKVMSLTLTEDVDGGAISIWRGGGKRYERGDAVLYAHSLYRCSVASHYSSMSFEDDKDNWQEVYASIRPWEAQKYYYLEDIVYVDLCLYKCLEAHTSDIDFDLPVERARWKMMGDFANVYEWTPDTFYMKNQVVTIQNILYRSLYSHQSDTADVENDSSFWEPLNSSVQYWSPGSYYGGGVLILANNKLYKCIVPHTAENTFELDYDNWVLIHTPPAIIEDWGVDVVYTQYQIVKFQGNLYRALYGHKSEFPFDPTKWELLTDSINEWTSEDTYVVGQYVNKDGILYKCVVANDDINFTIAKWQKISGNGLDKWAINTTYSAGDIVINANKIYQCNTSHTSGSTFTPDAEKWTEISACITRIPNWQVDTEYVVGDLVAYDSKIYRCITAHTSDPTEWNDIEETKWEELSPTINEISNWAVSTDYEIGQLVIHNNKLYRCKTAHTSDSTSFNIDIANWDEISGSGGIEPWKQNELYTQGNMVVRSNRIYVCDSSHTSGTTFDNSKWHQIATSNILTWASNMPYVVGDTVLYNGQLYRCITAHTSATFNNETANWQVLDTKWIAKNWSASTLYFANSVIVYNGTIYRANTTHVSGTSFEADKSKWDILNANIRTWTAGISYKVGDIVLKDKELLRCKVANNDSAYKGQNWELISKCHAGMWKAGPDPDILALLHFEIASDPGYNEYGASFSNLPNTAGGYFRITSGGKWGNCGDLTGPTTGHEGNMNSGARIRSPYYSFTNGETYTVEFWMRTRGDSFYGQNFGYIDSLGVIINLGGALFPGTSYQYVTGIDPRSWIHYAFVISPTTCTVYMGGTQVHSFTRPNSDPIRLTHWADTTASPVYGEGWIDEIRITKRAVYTSNFTPQTSPFTAPYFDGYAVGDIVVYNNKIYRCITANNDMKFTSSKWVEISKPQIPLWETSIPYVVGDIVIYNNQTYRCITAHTSGTFLDDISKWQVLDTNWLLKDWAIGKLYLKDQVVSYSDGLWKSLITHESTAYEPPTDAKIYEASGNVIEVDDTTIIPYTETIDLGSVKHITDIDYTESTSEMFFTYTIETSIDNITYENWTEDEVNARYIRLTVDSVNIDDEATSPNAYLDNFTVYGDSDKWVKISSGGSGDLIYATNSDIDNLFI